MWDNLCDYPFATSWDNRLEGPERYREFSWEL